MYLDEEIFTDIVPSNTLLEPLVNRKSHKSDSNTHRSTRVYDWQEFLSIKPRTITRYSKNIAPDTTDYTDYFLSLGATLLPDGSIDKSTMITTITDDQRHHGIISKKANKRVQVVIDWMVLLAKEKVLQNPDTKSYYSWKLNFVTLTLPSKQIHGDKVIIKECLQPFLDWCRKSKGVKSYFWRAETQANGNIHFHICTDVFLPWLELKVKWNHFVNKLGYTDRFAAKWNHRTPNSTDVHSLRKVKNVASYLSKYCGKNSKGVIIQLSKAKYYSKGFPMLLLSEKWNFPKNNSKFYRQCYCKLWGCSQNLSKLKSCITKENPSLAAELMDFEKKFPNRVILHDYSKTYLLDCLDLKAFGYHSIRNVLVAHVINIFKESPN